MEMVKKMNYASPWIGHLVSGFHVAVKRDEEFFRAKVVKKSKETRYKVSESFKKYMENILKSFRLFIII